ncbi:MAG: hypothetical protein O2890_15680 [Cyanobacteria bacterium]|nr:hypothetical protein [Cyanobacteriota bacterium]
MNLYKGGGPNVFNRPFDDQSQVKVFLETQAMLLVMQMITE